MSRVILYHARLPDRLGVAEAASLLERLPYAKRVTLASRRADREASLLGIALALSAAGRVRGRDLSPSLLRYPAGGRPAFATGAPVFSISHAAGLVVAAAALEGALGVDVEHAGSSRLQPSVRREWSAREAVAKALGLGLRAAAEVELFGTRARLRDRELRLTAIVLPDGTEAWLATDFPPETIEVEPRDPVGELRRHAA